MPKFFSWTQCGRRRKVKDKLSNEFRNVLVQDDIDQVMKKTFTKTFKGHLQDNGKLLMEGEDLDDPTHNAVKIGRKYVTFLSRGHNMSNWGDSSSDVRQGIVEQCLFAATRQALHRRAQQKRSRDKGKLKGGEQAAKKAKKENADGENGMPAKPDVVTSAAYHVDTDDEV